MVILQYKSSTTVKKFVATKSLISFQLKIRENKRKLNFFGVLGGSSSVI